MKKKLKDYLEIEQRNLISKGIQNDIAFIGDRLHEISKGIKNGVDDSTIKNLKDCTVLLSKAIDEVTELKK